MARLPITDSPLPDESLDSWVEHVAALIGLQTRELLRHCDIDVPYRRNTLTLGVDTETATRLAAATGADIPAIHASTITRFDGLKDPSGAISSRLRTSPRIGRYCAQCLAESNFRWKLLWHLQTSVVCTTHRRVLVDACPACIPQRPNVAATGWRSCPPHCWGPGEGTRPADQIESADILRAQTWIDGIASQTTTRLACNGRIETSRNLLTDIAVLADRLSSDPQKMRHYVRTDLSGAARAVTETFDELADNHPRAYCRILSNTLLYRAFTSPTIDDARQFMTVVPAVEALSLSPLPPMTDHKGHTGCATTRQLLTRHAAGPSLHQRGWYISLLRTTATTPLPAGSLPTRAWPALIADSPPVTALAAPVLPLTAVIALATIGVADNLDAIKRRLGLLLPDLYLYREVSNLLATGNSHNTLDYFHRLHAQLQHHPPPIDYHRRRSRFPTPSALYSTPPRRPEAARFVWQLLTGGDPFATVGTAIAHGPIIERYLMFCSRLTTDHRAALIAEAIRVLTAAGIDDEPLLYSPIATNRSHVLTDDELCSGDTSRFLHPGTHILDVRDPRRFVTAPELLERALTGDVALAGQLSVFTRLADTPLPAMNGPLSHQRREAADAENALEILVGQRLHDRGRHNARNLTPTGRTLLDEATPHLEHLRRIADHT